MGRFPVNHWDGRRKRWKTVIVESGSKLLLEKLTMSYQQTGRLEIGEVLFVAEKWKNRVDANHGFDSRESKKEEVVHYKLRACMPWESKSGYFFD